MAGRRLQPESTCLAFAECFYECHPSVSSEGATVIISELRKGGWTTVLPLGPTFWSLFWFQLLTATLLHSFGNHIHLCRTESERRSLHWAPSSSDCALGTFWEDAVAALGTAPLGLGDFICVSTVPPIIHSFTSATCLQFGVAFSGNPRGQIPLGR